jgi:endonuclease/exonuclease/phosphatase family metal-dependent hydrolase
MKSVFFLLSFILLFTGCHEDGFRLRLMSWNIHAGKDVSGKDNLDQIAEIINNQRIDIAALQEVDSMTTRSGLRDQLEYMAGKTGLYPVYAKNLDFQGGGYGIGFLSRFRPIRTRHVLLPVIPGREQRGMLEIEVNVGNRIMIIQNTHLDHLADDSLRFAQAKALTNQRPHLILGDLNDVPGSRILNLLGQNMFISSRQFTYPAAQPDRKIDYVLFSAAIFTPPDTVYVRPGLESDHRAVIAAWY